MKCIIVIPRENLTDLINFIYQNLVQNSGNINYMISRIILVPKKYRCEKDFRYHNESIIRRYAYIYQCKLSGFDKRIILTVFI